MSDSTSDENDGLRVVKPLSAAAGRALKEAEARRKSQDCKSGAKEIGGRDGPDPARYGDWEKDGILSDF